jgi:hypothetical protein
MSSLINFSIKNANGTYDKYTMSISDAQDNYGNNVAVWVQQTKEEREAKVQKKYVGNGKVQWTDGTINKAEYVEQKGQGAAIKSTSEKIGNDSSLPF